METRPGALAALTAAAVVAITLSPAAEAQQQGPPPVEVATPLTETIVDWDEYTGRFRAVSSVVLQARVSGYLDAIHFQEGSLVERGDLLYEIDRRPFEAAVAQAEAQLEAANARLDLAEIEVGRAEELLERNVGPESEAQRRRAEVREAVANVGIAEAALETAKLDLSFTRITAPIDGRISATSADVGNLVIGGPSGASEMANIVSVDPIEFTFTVSEADFLRYARLDQNGDRRSSRGYDTPVEVRLIGDEDWPWKGSMTFVDNQIDPNSGTMEGRATLVNPDQLLQPGLFGRLRLPGSGEYEAVLIPDEAIVADQARQIVYVLGDENVIEARGVRTGPIHRGLRVIREGLEADEQIVISGVQRARPGQPVQPMPTEIMMEGAEQAAEAEQAGASDEADQDGQATE